MSDIENGLLRILSAQRRAQLDDGAPDLRTRQDRLDRLVAMILDNEEAIINAERLDFAQKSATLIRLGEVMGPVVAARYTRSMIPEWMEPDPVSLAPEFEAMGVKAEIQHQPKGTVGIVVPWNGPMILSCMPLAGVLGAGNRAMLKPSELAPHSAELISRMVSEFFDETEVAVCTGDIDVAREFIKLPFDHLLYTGSSRIARQVLTAASENLVPVTLELGGKSPVIFGRDLDMPVAVERLAYGKLFHAGQVCVTPDYLFLPAELKDEFIAGFTASVRKLYPSVTDNADYSPIVNEQHFNRLSAIVDDARNKGAEVVCLHPEEGDLDSSKALKFPLHVIFNASHDMLAMQEEIFGPILPVKLYDNIADVFSGIAQNPNPLSAYYFGRNPEDRQAVSRNIRTGSIVFDDVVCQIFHEEIPFGGVGTSGMGRYRGHEGFKVFSNPVSVLTQTCDDEFLKLLRPPYGEFLDQFISQQLHPS